MSRGKPVNIKQDGEKEVSRKTDSVDGSYIAFTVVNEAELTNSGIGAIVAPIADASFHSSLEGRIANKCSAADTRDNQLRQLACCSWFIDRCFFFGHKLVIKLDTHFVANMLCFNFHTFVGVCSLHD